MCGRTQACESYFGLSICSFKECLLHLNISKQICYCKCFSVSTDASNTLTLDGLYAVPNNHAIDCTSAQPEDSQEQNRADTDMEINGNDHQTLINYLSAQPGFSMGPSTADTDLEVNDNNHQALDSLQVQPGSSDFSPDKATTKLEMNDKSHQTFDYLSAQQGSFQAAETPCRNNRVRKSPEGFDYLTSEKKRMADKAYREKCRVRPITSPPDINVICLSCLAQFVFFLSFYVLIFTFFRKTEKIPRQKIIV